MDKLDTFKKIGKLEKLIHEPSRLAILTALMGCQQADFRFLLNLVGMTKGNLSSHLSKLESGGLIVVEKAYLGKRPITYLSLTEHGRKSVSKHWQILDDLRKSI